jgi:excisionase family DNA binding protein
MPRTKTKTAAPAGNAVAPTAAPSHPGDVLTLAEAAAYLRIPAEDVVRLLASEGLPGRRVGKEWRFLKTAIQQWLSTPPARPSLLDQIGAARDDPYLEDMLKEIYRRRGRPETEDG